MADINWKNTTERFTVIINNKMMDTAHAGGETFSITWNDLRKVWYDWAEEMPNEDWFKVVENSSELRSAFECVINMIKQLHDTVVEKTLKGGVPFYKFEI